MIPSEAVNLKQNSIKVLQWAGQSLELNLTEMLQWDFKLCINK